MAQQPAKRCKTKGFSLIELMIVVAIIGILASIAVPSYRENLDRGRRASARVQLLQAAQYMQRFYAANDQYLADRAGTSVWSILPPSLMRAPADAAIAEYEISTTGATETMSEATPSTFTLRMRPLNPGPMATDSCGALTVTQSGAKGITGNPFTATPTAAQIAQCWR